MKYTANQDIRDHMADCGVTQAQLGGSMGKNVKYINAMLKDELPERDKEEIMRHIDAIVEDRRIDADADDPQEQSDVTNSVKFQIGDRVKIPSKQLIIGTIGDIWASLANHSVMYVVDTEDGRRGLYMEDQLEPAPLPVNYKFEAVIDGNVAVVAMVATQGEKTWIYARGHAHIIHDGEVGMAQAISYASKRMFESLDTKQADRIYFKDA